MIAYARSLVAYGVVAALWIVASLLITGFGVYAHLRYIVELAAVIGLVGVGQTIAVIGGGIDLSVSAVITVTAHHSADGLFRCRQLRPGRDRALARWSRPASAR